jgi:NAD(P)-dependent dehydrogenase (short-subunit alcohol dehydrogenase family)
MMAGYKNILITGVSSGFGRAIAEQAIHDGHHVIGTVRKEEDRRNFESLNAERASGYILDLADEASIYTVIRQAQNEHGPVDVLIANAGYGHEGLFEESSLEDLHTQFAVNVFGTVAVMQAVLPAMRERRFGYIFAITSVGGITTSPGLSFYHGTKYALEGILESLGKEVEPFGIHVTAIEPGPFRTDWSGRSMSHSKRTLADYTEFYEPIRKAREDFNGKQPGDPMKAAKAILTVMDASEPPAHLILGSAGLAAYEAASKAFQQDVNAWQQLSRSTDFAPDSEGVSA